MHADVSPYDRGVITALAPVRWFHEFGRPPRILGLDIARGLAILGMAGAHIGETEPFQWLDPATWTDLVHGRSSILFAVLAGISIALMTGRSANSLAPAGTLTRAEAATMLKAFCENVKK